MVSYVNCRVKYTEEGRIEWRPWNASDPDAGDLEVGQKKILPNGRTVERMSLTRMKWLFPGEGRVGLPARRPPQAEERVTVRQLAATVSADGEVTISLRIVVKIAAETAG